MRLEHLLCTNEPSVCSLYLYLSKATNINHLFHFETLGLQANNKREMILSLNSLRKCAKTCFTEFKSKTYSIVLFVVARSYEPWSLLSVSEGLAQSSSGDSYEVTNRERFIFGVQSLLLYLFLYVFHEHATPRFKVVKTCAACRSDGLAD